MGMGIVKKFFWRRKKKKTHLFTETLNLNATPINWDKSQGIILYFRRKPFHTLQNNGLSSRMFIWDVHDLDSHSCCSCFKVKYMNLALCMHFLVATNNNGFFIVLGIENDYHLYFISQMCNSIPFRCFLKWLNLLQHLLLMLNTIQFSNTLHSTLSKVLTELHALGFSASLSLRSAKMGKMGCRQLQSLQSHRKSIAQPRINRHSSCTSCTLIQITILPFFHDWLTAFSWSSL